MAVQGGEEVYATLLLSDTYLPGALVLAHSLRDAGTSKKLAVLVTLDTVAAEVVTELKAVYDYVISVPLIKNAKPENLYLMNRADLHSAFTKINLWKQTQFRKIVYVDADVVAYRAPDELFNLPHAFCAAPDIGWPDLFNTGVMVLAPNMGDYYAMMAMAERGISFDGADQGLLNMHFKNSYHRLPFTYNVTPSAHYQYIPAYKHFQSSINMVHFIGTEKPWFQGRHASTGSSPFNEMVGRWWAVYDRHYRQEAPLTGPSTGQQPPEFVQYFVKGEYQPRYTYVVPIGEPRLDQGSSTHGQQFAPPNLHYHQEHHYGDVVQHPHHATSQPEVQHQHRYSNPAFPPRQQQEEYKHHHQHHQEHHHHHSPLPEHPSEQSQSRTDHQLSFSSPSASFSVIAETKAEAPKEQVPEHQPWAPPPSPPPPPPPSHEPEYKHEQPKPPPMAPSWDAQRHPPPADSQPEALNFPQVQYEMSSDVAPFIPPARYPSPPKDMWYEVPKQPPARQAPKAIFPWESSRPRASRVFHNQEETLLEPVLSIPEGSSSESAGSSAVEPKSEPETPTTPTVRVTASDPWTTFTMTNAWDEVPEIERYVEGLQKHRRTKSQGTPASGLRLSGIGPGAQEQAELQSTFRRRGSKVTDFPSEVERPSLPVTPAPIRRPKFWGGGPGFGDEGEEDNQLLPAAEGVPRQTDWDPAAQLQKLAKQQSEMLLQKLGGHAVPGAEGSGVSVGAEGREIPTRPLPFGSEDAKSPTYVAQAASVLSPKPLKPNTSTESVRKLLGSQPEATPRTTAEDAPPVTEPSYQGPGLSWEKDEAVVPPHGTTAALPSEEEKDVLET